MRNAFKSSNTTISMVQVEVDAHKDLQLTGSAGKAAALNSWPEWHILYSYNGETRIHRIFATESEADASMDAMEAEAKTAEALRDY